MSILITRNQFLIYSNTENELKYYMFQILKTHVLGTIWFFTKIIISRRTTLVGNPGQFTMLNNVLTNVEKLLDVTASLWLPLGLIEDAGSNLAKSFE